MPHTSPEERMIALRNLLRGDIVFFTSKDVAHDSNAEHVGLVVSPDDQTSIRYAHSAMSSGVRQAKLEVGSPSVTKFWTCAFHCRNTDLASRAVAYASQWAVDMTAATTQFSEVRLRAMTMNKDVGGGHHFNGDALRRALKWAVRDGSEEGLGTLSAKVGVHCPMFVVACYHAAAMSSLIDRENLQLALGVMDDLRKTKNYTKYPKSIREEERARSFQLDRSTTGLAYALRPNSNIGFDASHADLFDTVLGMVGKSERDLEGAITRALYVDAKFVDVPALCARLRQDTDSWQLVHDWR
jgi:hypothetical protein